MINQVLVKKYTRGFVGAIEDQSEFRKLEKELRKFADLMRDNESLRQALVAPFLNREKKEDIFSAVVRTARLSQKTSRFILLLLEHKRLGLLEDIVAFIEEAWDEKSGVLTFNVTSAFPVSGNQKKKLQTELERKEKKPVRLVFTIDPGVIGGMSLKRGHIVYDASVEGNLLKLKRLIQQE